MNFLTDPFNISALIQAVTELLPISSSAHLHLYKHFIKTSPLPAHADVALHLGSLLAIICFFYKMVWMIVKGFFKTLFTFKKNEGFIVAMMVITATIPVTIAGFTIKKYYPLTPNIILIASSFVIFGLLSFITEYFLKSTHARITFSKSFYIGLAQVFALIPGASRLGVCTTMARALGIDRWAATAFSFILAIPSILGAISLTVFDLYKDGKIQELKSLYMMWPQISTIFITSLLLLPVLKWYLQKHTYIPFAVYRVLTGIILLALHFMGKI